MLNYPIDCELIGVFTMPAEGSRQRKSELLSEHQSELLRNEPGRTFAEVFPDVKSIRVEIAQHNHHRRPNTHRRVYTKSTLGPSIDCFNPMCARGSYDMRKLLREMTRNRVTDKKLIANCDGKETSQGVKVVRRRCHTRFEIEVHIEYWD
jgi:hypothetical protein